MSNEEQATDEAFDEAFDEVPDTPADDDETVSVVSNYQAELAAEQDRALRLQAEIQNLRARQARELTDARQYASIDLMREILPVVDNIDRALEAAGDSDEVASLLNGFKLVRQQLVAALAQYGCKPIDAEGQVFDPDRHQAILQQPSADVPAGQIMMVTQAGYQLHDRVVRAAQVIVSSGPGDATNIAATENPSEEQTA